MTDCKLTAAELAAFDAHMNRAVRFDRRWPFPVCAHRASLDEPTCMNCRAWAAWRVRSDGRPVCVRCGAETGLARLPGGDWECLVACETEPVRRIDNRDWYEFTEVTCEHVH